MDRRLIAILLITFAGGRANAEDSLATQAYGILQKNCLTCHGLAKASGLDLRTRESLLAGGTRGPAVTPFNSDP